MKIMGKYAKSKQIFFLLWVGIESIRNISSTMAACTSAVYCEGALLAAVQSSALYNDSKTFVDMPMRENPDVVVQEFEKLQVRSSGNVSREELQEFVNSYFLPAGQELEEVELPDWTDSPDLLGKISDKHLRAWASELNKLWKTLARKVKPDVGANPDRHSLLYVPNPFVIPGDRFREFYYWDTYWVVRGMLASNMTTTVKGILENFIYIFEKHGLIPNGGRVYFLNRSQPPLFTPMVHQYYRNTRDIGFIRDNIRVLEREYDWWMQNRSVEVEVGGASYQVNRYNVEIDKPRPEGYKEDLEVVEGMTQEEAAEVLSHIASACESGQDFSSRWFEFDSQPGSRGPPEPGPLRTIRTRHIAPLDLNVFLGLCENILAEFFKDLGDDAKQSTYERASAKRLATINALFWDPDERIWFDLDIVTRERRSHFHPSNVYPLLLYTDNHGNQSEATEKLNDVITYLEKQKVLDYPGGIPSSKYNTGQQWDFPNVWPPSMALVIEALAAQPVTTGRHLAYTLAQRWVEINYRVWNATGDMYEKYNAENPDRPGGGGEYAVQKGFGSTNGIILHLLSFYKYSLKSGHTTPTPPKNVLKIFAGVVSGVVLLFGILIFCQMKNVVAKRKKRIKRLRKSMRNSVIMTFYKRVSSAESEQSEVSL